LVKLWQGLVLLFGQKVLDSGFLRRGVLEDQQHAIHRQTARGGATIELRACERMGVTLQHDKIALIDGLLDAALRLGCLRESRTCQSDEQNS
jgi:hypothetical protein